MNQILDPRISTFIRKNNGLVQIAKCLGESRESIVMNALTILYFISIEEQIAAGKEIILNLNLK